MSNLTQNREHNKCYKQKGDRERKLRIRGRRATCLPLSQRRTRLYCRQATAAAAGPASTHPAHQKTNQSTLNSLMPILHRCSSNSISKVSL